MYKIFDIKFQTFYFRIQKLLRLNFDKLNRRIILRNKIRHNNSIFYNNKKLRILFIKTNNSIYTSNFKHISLEKLINSYRN